MAVPIKVEPITDEEVAAESERLGPDIISLFEQKKGTPQAFRDYVAWRKLRYSTKRGTAGLVCQMSGHQLARPDKDAARIFSAPVRWLRDLETEEMAIAAIRANRLDRIERAIKISHGSDARAAMIAVNFLQKTDVAFTDKIEKQRSDEKEREKQANRSIQALTNDELAEGLGTLLAEAVKRGLPLPVVPKLVERTEGARGTT